MYPSASYTRSQSYWRTQTTENRPLASMSADRSVS